MVRIVNIDTFGQVIANPLEYVEDDSVEDNLFQENDVDVFWRKIGELGAMLF